VHAMFIKLPQIAPSYDGRDNCRGWLCGIAVRMAMRHRRGVGRFRRMLGWFAETSAPPSGPDPERLAGGREQVALLERALEALSEKKRAVFVLVELEGLSAEEAARAMAPGLAGRLTRIGQERVFVLHWRGAAEESIYLSQRDVRELQFAKAAIATGWTILLEEAGLPYVSDVPLVGVVSRLVWQKGFDLCAAVLPTLLARRRVQLVVLGYAFGGQVKHLRVGLVDQAAGEVLEQFLRRAEIDDFALAKRVDERKQQQNCAANA